MITYLTLALCFFADEDQEKIAPPVTGPQTGGVAEHGLDSTYCLGDHPERYSQGVLTRR
ncbi:MAG: hypothetical protein M3443_00600 [Actinomycetota bacterium]|nr:hypothetical protein [Actinomycetota bacterium]